MLLNKILMCLENVFIGNPLQKGEGQQKGRSKIEDEFMISNVRNTFLILSHFS